MSILLADNNGVIGEITPPPWMPTNISSIATLFGNILRLVILVAGIWAFINFIIAGMNFLSAGGDAKKVEGAWQRIYLSVIGLLIIVASFLLAAIVGFLLFNDPLFIFNPKIYTAPTP